MRSRLLLAVIAVTGCYHSILTTDLPPSTEMHREPYKAAFIWGLVPARVDASKYCEGRRWARVETQYNVLNAVIGIITAGIFTPMDIRVTCAAAGAMNMPSGEKLQLGAAATEEERSKALALAIALARESGKAIYVAY